MLIFSTASANKYDKIFVTIKWTERIQCKLMKFELIKVFEELFSYNELFI